MAKLRILMIWAVLGSMVFVNNSCVEDNPTIILPDKYTGPTENGNLEVFARKGTPTGPYLGNAVVKIFLTDVDRTNNNVYQSNVTDPDDPIARGALFSSLPFQKYFISVSWTGADGLWMGVGESFVPKGTTTKYHVTCIQ